MPPPARIRLNTIGDPTAFTPWFPRTTFVSGSARASDLHVDRLVTRIEMPPYEREGKQVQFRMRPTIRSPSSSSSRKKRRRLRRYEPNYWFLHDSQRRGAAIPLDPFTASSAWSRRRRNPKFYSGILGHFRRGQTVIRVVTADLRATERRSRSG